MIEQGYGQLLMNGEWLANVVYAVNSRSIGEYQHHRVHLAPRRGMIGKLSSIDAVELICANGVRYKIRGEFEIGAGGAYVANLIPLPAGVEVA